MVMFYHSFNEEMKKRFGTKVYRLSLDGGFTCPNRDGTLGTRGCIFCLDGSGAFAERKIEGINEQIEKAKEKVSNKIKNGKFIAYFQSYTNTYGPVSKLRRIFMEAINHPDIAALSIGTRPDCLSDETVELLTELNKIKPVWVELGLQTIHEKTAEYIRRGYTQEIYDEAVKKLKKANVEVITHMIIGLPGETRKDIIDTAKYIGKSGSDGIKLQLLHVLRGTDLAEDYEKGRFKTLELKEYAEIVGECLKVLPRNVVIHRMTGDGAKKDLIAPKWSADKKKVLNFINDYLKNIDQGSSL